MADFTLLQYSGTNINSVRGKVNFLKSEEVDIARLGTNVEKKLIRGLVILDNLKRYTINKIFIRDGIYSSGTSITVYKNKIQKLFNNEIEFSYATLIKTK